MNNVLNQFLVSKRKHSPIVHIGLIGLGAISAVHIDAFRFHPNAKIVAIADTNSILLHEKTQQLPNIKAYDTYRQVITDPRVDVVDIMLPHFLHAQVIVEALKAGKDVICEKPLVITDKEFDAISRESKKTGKQIYLKQYFRFSRLHQQVRMMLLDGAIGRPYHVSCAYTINALASLRDHHSWRFNTREAGGGVFMDIGVHIIDYLSELFGAPRAVFAVMKKNFTSLPQKGEDFATIILEFPAQVVVQISCTAVDTSFGFRWEKHFYGSDASIHITDNGKTRMTMEVMRNKRREDVRVEKNWWYAANYEALQDIVTRLAHHDPPAVTLEDAKSTLGAILGAYESAETGRKIVLR